jgi:hypothetical protein
MYESVNDQVIVLRKISDKCEPIFQYLFCNRETSMLEIPKDRAKAFITHFKIITKDKQ